MELISKEVVRRIIDSGRTKEQMLGMVESAVTFEECDDCIGRKAVSDLIEHYEEEILADNRLIAVSGMSIEELTDAFTKGYRLVSLEKNDQIPDTIDIRVTAEEAAKAIQNLTKAGISQGDIESSDLPLYNSDERMGGMETG